MALEELVIEITSKCPMRCRHCSSESDPDYGKELEEHLSISLVREAKELGASTISFGGGEPTISKHFGSVLEEVSSLGMKYEIFTCGSYYHNGDICPLPVEVINILQKHRNGKIIFSVHGSNPETHDYITTIDGSFESLLTSVKKCIDVGIKSEFNFVPMKPNLNEFEEVVDLAIDFGLKRISVLRFVPQGRGQKNRGELEISPEEEKEFIKELIKLRPAKSAEIRTGSPFNNLIEGNCIPCRAGSEKIVIQADGNVLPCEVFKHSDRRNWGLSVYSMNLNDILNSSILKSFSIQIKRTNELDCPVHRALIKESHRGTCEQFSKTSVRT